MSGFSSEFVMTDGNCPLCLYIFIRRGCPTLKEYMTHRYTAFKEINKPGRYSTENTLNIKTPELAKGCGLAIQFE
jgi:hypothetical protein